MADFFGFNPASDFDQGLRDDPGGGLDEDLDDYDALNDETFGADSMGGDWEQSHEELAEIAEKSRVHRDSYNSATDDQHNPEFLDDIGFEDLALEASLSQLVDDCDDNLIGDERKTKVKQLQRGVISGRVIETGYSCSPPSEFNVWAVNKNDQVRQQQAQKPRLDPAPPPTQQIIPGVKKIHTLEELERGLRAQSSPAGGHKQPRPPGAALRLEDVERDLTAAKLAFPPGFPRHQPPFTQHPQDVVLLRNTNNGLPPGYPAPPPQQQQRHPPPPGMRPPPNATFGQILVPTQLQPGMVDFRNHGSHRHMGPEMMRFLPPHLLMHQQGYQQHRNNMNFRPPYPPMSNNPLMDPRNFPPGCRPPFPWNQGPPGPRFPPNRGPRENGYHRDEYDGLMTNREIQWLLNIQQIQLDTQQPYVDDFYYTVFRSRKPKNRVESRNGRERRDSLRDNRPESQIGQQPRVYTPLQFENSLGKLQCGSVTAPRKIIDMDVVQEASDSPNSQALMKDSRKAKQLLLQLEQLYLLLMQVEDMDNPLAAATDPTLDKATLVQKIVTSLTCEDRLQAAMCVRKGKNLILRLLPHLDPSATVLQDLWSCVTRHLITIGRRDAEADLLLRFYPHLERWLKEASFDSLAAVVAGLRVTTPYPPSRNVLVFALGNKFGVTALNAIVARGETLHATATPDQSRDWSTFARDLIDASTHVTAVAPMEPGNLDALTAHAARHGDARLEKYASAARAMGDKRAGD